MSTYQWVNDYCETNKKQHDLKGLMAFFDASPDAIAIITNETVLYCNEVIVRLFKAPSLNALLGKSPIVFVDVTSKESAVWRMKALESNDAAAQKPMHRVLTRADGEQFEAMIYARALTEINQPNLIVLTVQDLTESLQRERMLAKSRQRFNEITEQSIALMERERHLLSQEIHDDFGQFFIAMKLRLGWLKKQVDDSSLYSAINELEAMSTQKGRQARQMASQLRPPELDEINMQEACQDLLRLCLRDTCTTWHVVAKGDIESIPANIQTVAFRIVQEAVSNLLKYAEATHVAAAMTAENDALTLSIKDDGRGFVYNPDKLGLGLRNMKERAELLRGTLTIVSQPGQGTELTLSIPYSSYEPSHI